MKQSQEYSEEIQPYIDSFPKFDLSKEFVYPGFGNTQAKVVAQRQTAQRSVSNF
jgi:hypothetical protein